MACKARNRHGAPCGAPQLHGSEYCFTHDPERAGERAEARRRGGLAVHGIDDGPTPEVRIETVGDVLALLETTAGELKSRKASISKSRAVAYLASVCLKALEVGALEERVSALEEQVRAASPRGPRIA